MPPRKVQILSDVKIQRPKNTSLTTDSFEDSDLSENEWDEWDEVRVFSDSDEEYEYFRSKYSNDPVMKHFLHHQELLRKTRLEGDKDIGSSSTTDLEDEDPVVRVEPTLTDPVISKSVNCDKEIQCNMTLDKDHLSSVVQICANLDIDNFKEFSELIRASRNILNSQENKNGTTIEGSSCEKGKHSPDKEAQLKLNIDTIPQDFLPSRKSLTSDMLSQIVNADKKVLPSQASPIKQNNNSKIVKNADVKKSLQLRFSEKSKISTRSTRNNKKSENTRDSLKNSPKNTTIGNGKKKSTNKINTTNADQTEINLRRSQRSGKPVKRLADEADYSSDEGVFKKPMIGRSLKKRISEHNLQKSMFNKNGSIENKFNSDVSRQCSRSLGRSWLRKGYSCGNDLLNDFSNRSQDSGFTSFQNQKSRRLYSPSRWSDFVCLEEPNEENRYSQSIFKK